tara:strand:+ start:38 stop:262 length:225 start_codon:yes stop_codon:yes gene_type:complete
MSKIQDLLKEKENLQQQLHDYEKKISEIKKLLKDMDKTIYQTCEHKWIRDYDNYDDLSKKYCLQCGLRDYYMYR